MSKLLAILALLPMLCRAQVGVEMPILYQRLLSSPSVTLTNFMTGLAYAWEFTNNSVTTNATVTNWIDEIQGSILTNGAAASRPTNSASGLGFTGNTYLTNIVPIDLGTNWIITVRYLWTGGGANLSAANYNAAVLVSSNSLAGTTSFNWMGFHGNVGGTTRAYRWSTPAGAAAGSSPDLQQAVENYFVDFCLVMSNSAANGNGGGYAYTNGGLYQASTSSGNDYIPQSFNVGAVAITNSSPIHFIGNIQAIYIQTGSVAIAAGIANASNIHYWVTNYLVKGATP